MHAAQVGGAPGAVSTVPAAQLPFVPQLDWFAVDVLVPAGHVLHCRAEDAVPAVLTNEPGVQVAQAVQLVAFDVVLNVPFAQAAHPRSVVPLGVLVA